MIVNVEREPDLSLYYLGGDFVRNIRANKGFDNRRTII